MKRIILLLLLVFSSNLFSQWKQINGGILGENIYAFRLIGDRLFAGTQANLVWSPNFGVNWYIDSSQNYFGVFSFEKMGDIYFCINGNDQKVGKTSDFGKIWEDTKYLKTNGGMIYATVTLKDRIYVAELNKGIQYSSDFGDTWIFAGSKMVSSKIIYSMETMEDTIYVGGQGGLFRTNDLGITWENVGFNHDQINVVKVYEKKIYIATWSNGLQVSEDFGKTWNKLEIDPTIKNIRSIAFTKNPKNDSTVIFIGTQGNYPEGFSTAGIYMSLDMGKTWLKRSDGFIMMKMFQPTTTTFYFVDKYVFVGVYKGGMYRAVLKDLIAGTAVNEKVTDSDFCLFPNPTSEKLIISNIPEGALNFEIFDNLGHKVSSGLMDGEIDVSKLTPGIYFIKIGTQPPLKFVKI